MAELNFYIYTDSDKIYANKKIDNKSINTLNYYLKDLIDLSINIEFDEIYFIGNNNTQKVDIYANKNNLSYLNNNYNKDELITSISSNKEEFLIKDNDSYYSINLTFSYGGDAFLSKEYGKMDELIDITLVPAKGYKISAIESNINFLKEWKSIYSNNLNQFKIENYNINIDITFKKADMKHGIIKCNENQLYSVYLKKYKGGLYKDGQRYI